MKYLIYKHTNKVNHKCYIGQTCRADDPNLRWQNGYGYSKCRKFYNAIKKYGWDSFEHEILAEVDNVAAADELEIEFIKKFDSIKNGYNITLGGAGRHIYKPVLQMDLDKNIIARFDSIAAAEIELNLPIRHSNITQCCNGTLRTSHGYCWCYEADYETYEIKSLKKAPHTNIRGKAVYQLLRDKTIVAEFPSALAAYKTISGKTNCKSDEAIQACCKGKRKSAYGYFWCYKQDYDDYKITLSYYQQKVLQMDPNTGAPIAVHANLGAAAKAVDGISGKIGEVCRGKRRTTAGYGWRFIELEEEKEIFINDLWYCSGR